jgi:hypothetical protein
VSGSGGTTKAEQLRYRKLAEMADRIREDRAAGRKRCRGAGAALVWYARTREAWSSPKALTMRDEGSGAPSQGAESPSRRRFAAVAAALKAAELDDQKRNEDRPAPIARWVLEHFGMGRAATWIAEGSGDAWSEPEVTARLHRVCRVVRDRLRAGGWLDDGGGEDGAT